MIFQKKMEEKFNVLWVLYSLGMRVESERQSKSQHKSSFVDSRVDYRCTKDEKTWDDDHGDNDVPEWLIKTRKKNPGIL